MIRYAYSPKLGHVYYELMPDGELREVDPHAVLAALNANPSAPVEPTPTAHWSPWLPWKGGPCPLPGETVVEVGFRGGAENDSFADDYRWVLFENCDDIIRFRYRSPDPAGWLPRGDWIPPAELWAPECPVRCEWTYGMDMAHKPGSARLGAADWGNENVTHIRLVAREAKAGLPDGFHIGSDGNLYQRSGLVFTKDELAKHGPAAIRQAVDAWLRGMGDE